MEDHVSTYLRKPQDGVLGPESPSLGHHTQSVVEISHGCSSNILGKGEEVE